MFDDPRLNEGYPTLARLSSPLRKPERAIVGREHETQQLLASLSRPELCNALLLAPAGAGKTALVQATMLADPRRLYLEVDPSRMIADAGDDKQMAATLKRFFDEAERFAVVETRDLVLFIDEFHQIVQLSDAAVEAIKPVLAASGQRGLRIIAATTFDEFHQHIAPNQPLVERLQRLNVASPDQETTVTILRDMAERYAVDDQFFDDHLFRLIWDLTNRYQPAQAQPRKSILVLDSMVGWHRLTGRPLDRTLLVDVLQESVGVNIALAVDGSSIKRDLDAQVFAQDWATTAVAKRLQLSVADLNDKTRPEASFLFAGSTGTGKTQLARELAKLLFGDDQRHLVRFDMTEYAEDKSLAAFRGELTRRVWDMSHAVLLFDEIEKASPLVTRVLLQVLDDGRLLDENHREVGFLNTYIVCTTNAGQEVWTDIARYNESDTGERENLRDYERLIRRSLSRTTGGNRFPPELLGRLDQIVPFQALSARTRERILTRKMQELAREVHTKHNVVVSFTQSVLTYLVEDRGEDEANEGGARTAVARLTDEVTTEIARYVNENPRVHNIVVGTVGELAAGNKHRRVSAARVFVGRADELKRAIDAETVPVAGYEPAMTA